MIHIVYSPEWFYGKDIIIDIFSIFVLSLIAVFSIRYYKINKKNKNYFWFAVSFFTLAASFLFKILTNFDIYYNIIDTERLGYFTFTYSTVATSDILFSIGFFFYIFLTLTGFFILYLIYQKNTSKQNIILISFLLLITSFFSASKYFVFHLTSLILLLMIIFNYSENYLKRKNRHSGMLYYSFLIIALSQLIFIFVGVNPLFYVLAELVQLLGYILLSITFINVFKNAKKK